MEQNQREGPFIKEQMVQNQSEVLNMVEEMAHNHGEVPFRKEEMVQNQSLVPFIKEEMAQNRDEVPYMVEVMAQNQSRILNMVEEMQQQLSVGDKLQYGEKSSSNVNCEEDCEEQEKDKAFKTNVEDASICRKESLNSNENALSVKLENLKQEPSIDVHYMENANTDGNNEQYNEEENKQQVINDFEMGSLEIKSEIIDSMLQQLKQEVDFSNETESREQSLEADSEDYKQEIIKCLANVIYKCLTCSETFSSREFQEQHKCPTPYRCPTCMKVLTNEPDLCKHMLRHKIEPCRICGKTFINKNYYLKHLRAHNGIGYKCAECGQVFSSSSLFIIHSRRHTGEPYICDFCGKTFVVNLGYQTHLKQHTGEKKFECPTCLKKFPLKNTLKSHIRIHTGERPYVCVICGNCFRDPGGLWRHTNKVHRPKVKEFKCHLCPKEYVQSSELEAHLRRHTGERPYECNICGKKYIFKACLASHIKLHADKSYKCAVRKRTFPSISLRDRHVRTHAGETYSCATCDKAFSSRKNIIKHVFKFQH